MRDHQHIPALITLATLMVLHRVFPIILLAIGLALTVFTYAYNHPPNTPG